MATDLENAAAFREAVHEGYDDVKDGRTLPLESDLRSMIAVAKERDGRGWTQKDTSPKNAIAERHVLNDRHPT